MAVNRSFTDYIKKRFDNNFWAVAEDYLHNNTSIIEKIARKLHKVGEFKISDITVEYV